MDIETVTKTKAEKHRESVRKNYYKNKEKKLKSIMEYRKQNPEKYREYHRLYYHQKIKKVEAVVEEQPIL
jgi:hypothetical protein